jgi:mono/diheme cytochrome c family protein
MVRRFVKLALIVTGGIVAASPSLAADLARGAQLARQWCASCHVVGHKAPKVIQQGPPSFQAIAQSRMTPGRLRVFLSHPHGGMPDLSLSRAEIDDLIAYIETFR